jgi:hypothetical protein
MLFTFIILLLGLGGAAFIAHDSIQDYLGRLRIIRQGAPAEGLVEGVEERSAGEVGTSYHPVVRFVTQEQVEVTACCPYPLRPSHIRYDEWRPLHYLPHEPQRFVLDEQGPGRRELWSALVVAASLVGIGAWLVLQYWLRVP